MANIPDDRVIIVFRHPFTKKSVVNNHVDGRIVRFNSGLGAGLIPGNKEIAQAIFSEKMLNFIDFFI